MTYATLRDTVGREPVTIVEVDLDRCTQPLYGGGLLSPLNGDCEGSQSAGSECYHTRKTCQDVTNFSNSSDEETPTPLVLKFSDRLIDGEDYFPCIVSTKLTPVGITPGQPFNTRASITIVFQDFPHHDRGIDPYASTRSYTPEDQGTFFGKLLSRNPFYQGRALRLKTGYVDDPFSTGDLQTQNFIIEKFTGPDKNGRFTVIAKDILKLADDERSLLPIPSTGKLVAAISAGATSLTVTSGTELDYIGEYIRIGDEIIDAPIANRSANVFSNLARGAWNTTASSHTLDDAVQECEYFNDVNIIDLYDDILTNFAGISADYIPTADWTAEKNLWLTATNLTALIAEPTGVKTLLDELSEQTMTYIWWDAINQEIPLKAIAPIAARTVELSDDNHIMDDPDVNIVQEDRVSRVLIYYNPRTPINFKEPKDFDSLYGFISTAEESEDQYNDTRTRAIFARWITSDSLAVQVGSRTRNQFRDPPKLVVFDVDAKDSTNVVGDYIDLNTRALPDDDGSNKITPVQILKVEEITKKAPGTHYRLTCQVTQFAGRYARIMANTSPDGDYSTATDTEKASGGFIVGAGLEVFTSDNGEAYKIA